MPIATATVSAHLAGVAGNATATGTAIASASASASAPVAADASSSPSLAPVRPATLAVIDDDREYAEYLAAHLQKQGIEVRVFHDSDEFLLTPGAFDFEFYVLDLMLPGVDGVDLIRLVRRRGPAGIVVVSGRVAPDVFDEVLRAGADMYLMKPVRFEQVALAIETVQRRIVGSRAKQDVWRFERAAGRLVAPDGTRIDLSGTDIALVECFVAAEGALVTRATLCERIGRDPVDEADNLLHAAIYRLRRRIERATRVTVPLQSEPKLGYLFRAPLVAV